MAERLSKAESNLATAKVVGVVAVILTFLFSDKTAFRITRVLFDYLLTLVGGVILHRRRGVDYIRNASLASHEVIPEAI